MIVKHCRQAVEVLTGSIIIGRGTIGPNYYHAYDVASNTICTNGHYSATCHA